MVLWLGMVVAAQGQWTLQESHSTADLRGIHALGGGVAWASGSGGTVLRTVDAGKSWTQCAVPPGSEKLDFRGVQGFDAKTAIVMSSGTGDLSRLYKTVDGCASWKLLFNNPDKEGFWDAITLQGSVGTLLGDPVHGSFYLAVTRDGGKSWIRQMNKGLAADAAVQGAFAASNSSFSSFPFVTAFVSGGNAGAFVYVEREVTICLDDCSEAELNLDGRRDRWSRTEVPVGNHSEGSGIFSLAMKSRDIWVAVGGDYTKPNETAATAAYTVDKGMTWIAAATAPGGYRSAVAYDAARKVWITVGPNGTDVSEDDGRNWRPLKPGPGDAVDADRRWNALSLPFVVGPHGRIGVLRDGAVSAAR